MSKAFNDLPKPAKVAVSKAMKKAGYKYEEIADILEIGERSAYRYVREMQSTEWRDFGEVLDRLLTVTEADVEVKLLDLIKNKMGSARFSELTTLYKTIKDGKAKPGPQTAVAIQGDDMKIEFIGGE
jgi:hypothetical protein